MRGECCERSRLSLFVHIVVGMSRWCSGCLGLWLRLAIAEVSEGDLGRVRLTRRARRRGGPSLFGCRRLRLGLRLGLRLRLRLGFGLWLWLWLWLCFGLGRGLCRPCQCLRLGRGRRSVAAEIAAKIARLLRPGLRRFTPRPAPFLLALPFPPPPTLFLRRLRRGLQLSNKNLTSKRLKTTQNASKNRECYLDGLHDLDDRIRISARACDAADIDVSNAAGEERRWQAVVSPVET